MLFCTKQIVERRDTVMKKLKKSLISLFLAVCMVFTLTSCGQESAVQPEGEQASAVKAVFLSVPMLYG